MGGVESVAGHIFKALGKAIVNILVAFIVGFIVAFIVVVAAIGIRHHSVNFLHFGVFVYVGAIIAGIVVGYAGAVTMLLVAAVREAFALARGAVGEAKSAVGEVEHGLGSAIDTVEHRK